MKQEFIREQERELGIVRAEPQAIALTPAQLVQVAVQRGDNLEYVRELMQLEREWKADRAREAYIRAMSAFKAEPLKLTKDKHVQFTTSRGVTEYNHATLAQVVDAVVASLSRHGLSHRWETQQEANKITVTCVITHELGHSERTTLFAAPDDSGGKNSIQAIGSTVSYLQRYTLMAATGLAARDMDNDGRSAGKPPEDKITDEQLADLKSLMQEVGADEAAFLKVCKLDAFENMPASKYAGAVKKLEAKRAQS